MRLSKIKLAGFKSFVDPTTLQFPSSLMGVVGPNGCGKSNIIDAVRWVMGESSAKTLRGDSMADVIFNGSSARKPVGAATVELIFDNSDGKIGGQYAGYNEISVKRVCSRDGTSNYYLNNTRCRRKDITSIFLGTGLGPRSYSIIEQGMISRLIEAKPEEMRTYLEEAAGISKYKERRRETENRIRHTKDNLSRLNDLRDEIEKQIRHLERQARTAERYKKQKEKERRLRAELLALRLGDLQAQEGEQASLVSERETQLQAAIARLREIEADIEKAREAHAADSDALNDIQGRYYRVGAEIARLEQSIQHALEMRRRQEADLGQVVAVIEDLRRHIDRDEAQIKDLSQSLGELGPGLQSARAAESASAEALRSAEKDMQNWQSRWELFNEESGETSRIADVEKARIEQIEAQMHRLLERRERRSSEIARLSGLLEGGEIAQLEAEERESNKQAIDLESDLEEAREEIESLRKGEKDGIAALDGTRGDLQKVVGELASLEALQEAALGRKDGAVMDWLEGRGLGDRPRLAERLVVEDGWEDAAETVLGGYLEAVCVDGLEDVATALDELTHGTVSFLEAAVAEGPTGGEGSRMLDKVSGPPGTERLLAGIRVADSLADALAARSSLGPGESIVTREGVWIGTGWLRFHRASDAEGGLIQREQEIREHRQRLADLQSAVESLEQGHAEITENLRALERRRDSIQGQINEAHRRHGDVHGRLSTARARQEQTRSQITQFRAEAAEIDAHLEEAEEELRTSRRALETSVGQMSVFEARRQELQNQRATLTTSLEAARERAAADRNAAHEIAIKVESRKSTRDSATVALDRLRAQLEQSVRRHDELKSQLQEGREPQEAQQRELDSLLEQQVGVEAELSAARDKVQEVENRLRAMQEKRQSREREGEDVRASLDELRLAAREIQVRRQTIAEQFAETGFDLEVLRTEIDEEASIPLWEESLEKLAARIQRLGPINLASIDELKEQTERKEYLDSQFEDLTEALNTLENAIRRIDRETRTRFKETFDRVNAGMKDIFPRLFGGGHAYLELTGEDLLDSGVTVMARPPGKRISTIHLLSGGEKALTAVALVFAIFHLNPAPFCMLDEVDAPLDDANVGRFCDIVRDMSDRVQFIVITHNKVTMEMTHQLAGVTMHEPGVSRLVAVDLDEAVQMAAM
ncbi:MAG: chromosome segregation protein SMC [Gammaproteobacteria bacterium SG8_31]|nr:MAG: chromosome segregation protein SMC [Gammaproteobacteria bacterium SG8_31]